MTRTLAGRLVLMAVAVATVASLVTGLLLLGLTRSAASDAVAASLRRDVELLAAAVEDGAAAERPRGVRALERVLEGRGVRIAVVPADEAARRPALPRPLRPADIAAASEEGTLSDSRRVLGRPWVVEGRLAGDQVVLAAQPLDAAAGPVVETRRRIGAALVVGLLVAALAGLLLSRALAGPLRRVASAADRLTAGDRAVRLPPVGPTELASLARAMNGLSDALARSEGRQRQFLLSVSHELRTPLTSVLGYAEALADDALPPGERARAARVLRAEAQRLQARVEDLLALARLEADDFRVRLDDIDVADVLTAAEEAWQVRADAAGVPLRLELTGTPLVARTDGERLRQIVDALVDNALRVLPPGAPVVLAGGRGGEPAGGSDGEPAGGRGDEPTGGGGDEPTSGVSVQVRDGGPGLAAGDYAVAFEPGELTRRYDGSRPVGSGVGLALVARLTERLGGAVTASPAPEGGLAVTVTLPGGAEE